MRWLLSCQLRTAAMVFVCPAVALWGQEPPATQPAAPAEPVPDAPPPPARRPFALHVNQLYAGMELDYRSRRVRYDDAFGAGTVQKNRDLRVSEYVGFGLDGFIGDPNLFDYTATMEIGATQNRFEEEINSVHRADSDNGALLRYDLSLDILRSKPLSFNAFARRTDDRIARRFLPSLRQRETEAGITGLAVTGPVTTQFGFSWRDLERTGNRLEEDDEQLQATRAFVDSTWQISDRHRFRVSYEHEDQGSNYQGSLYNFDLKRDELRVEDEFSFGPGNRHRFDAFLRYNQENGDLERDELHFAPRLTLQHTDKFRTVYRYNYYRVHQDVVDVEQHKFDVESLYQATRNLRLSTDAFGLYEHADRDVETVQYGLGGDLGYAKSLSSGDLNVNLHVSYDEAQTHGSAGRRLVRGEAHKLSDVVPVFLNRRHVVKITVLAHSENYNRVYVPGRDYLLVFLRDRTLVSRVPTGRISRDEIVYFDYQYEVPAEAEIESWWTNFLVEHRFKWGLVPYYSFDGRFQDVDERSLGTPAYRDNQNRHRIGARYERSWWNVGTEYEIFDDTVEPYDAVHLTGQASVLRRTNHALDLTGVLSRYWFEGGVDDRRVWWAETSARDTIQILQNLSMQTQTVFHWEDDSIQGKTHGVDLEWGFKYVRGYLSVALTFEYDLLAIAENRDQSYGVFLNVRRDLSHLLPVRERE